MAPLPCIALPTTCGSRLDAAACAAWRRDGILRVTGVVDTACLQRIGQALIARLGAPPEEPAAWGQMRAAVLKPIGRDPACVPVEQASVRAVIDQLIRGDWSGRRADWNRSQSGGTWFVNPPRDDGDGDGAEPPRGEWHWDGHPHRHDCSGAWVFTLLADLPAGAGGTWLVAGSHAEVAAFHRGLPPERHGERSRILKKAFAIAHPWYAALNGTGPLPDDGPHGAPLRLVQVQGRAGDVLVMRPLTVHSRPRAIGPGPRLVHVIGVTPG